MPLTTSQVYDIAADMLASLAARLADPPTRQYVHAGEPAWDCEALIVTVPESGLQHSFPGEAATVEQCSPPRHVNLQAWVIRCVPTLTDNGEPPTVADLDASAAVVLADVWTMAYELWDGWRDKDWGQPCTTVLFGPVSVIGPEGGYTAVRADVFLLVT